MIAAHICDFNASQILNSLFPVVSPPLPPCCPCNATFHKTPLCLPFSCRLHHPSYGDPPAASNHPYLPPATGAKVDRRPVRGSDLHHPLLMNALSGGSSERRGGWRRASLHELSGGAPRSREHSVLESPSQGAFVDATGAARQRHAWQHRLFHHLAAGCISSWVVTRAVALPGLSCNAPRVCYQPEEDKCGHITIS